MTKINFTTYFSDDYPGYETFAKEVLQPIFGEYYIPEPVAEDFLGNNNGYKATERANIKDIKRVATIEPTDGNASFFPMDVYDITVSDHSKLSRSRVGIQHFIRSNSFDHAHALMIFHYETPQGRSWRFSYFYKGTTLTDTTNAKRYTYLFGKGEKVRTADLRFNSLLETFHKKDYLVTDGDIEKAFSVEKLSDEFFDKYLAFYVSFVKFITGKTDSKEDKKTGINSATFRNTLKMIEAFGKHDEEDQYHKYFMPKCQNNEKVCDKRVRDYVKKMMGRLVFLHFLQRKGWMCGDRDFMLHLFERSEQKDDFLDRVLEPLFFAVLNTHPDKRKAVCESHNNYPYNKAERVEWQESLIDQWQEIPYLNGGLFEQEKIDECRTKFPKEYFQALFNFFDEYNFTIDENDPHDAIVGVDPEMLSKIFENLLEDNNDKGAFYTPKTIVHYMCTESLIAYLKEKCKDSGLEDAQFRSFILEPASYPITQLSAEQHKSLSDALTNIRVCDPAIGSGAFPMGMLNCIYACRHELEPEKTAFEIKLHIIQNNIFGVDIEQGAVDIARLRFWLALVVDEETPHALPNLDYRIVRGNSLLTTFNGEHVNLHAVSNKQHIIRKEKNKLMSLQKDYYSYSGEEKLNTEIQIKGLLLDILKLQIGVDKVLIEKQKITDSADLFTGQLSGNKKLSEKAEKESATKSCLLMSIDFYKDKLKNPDRSLLEKARTDINFFDWEIMFADVFDNEERGFDIVIGNPPYLRIQGIRDNDPALADTLTEMYKSATGKFDLYVPFIEKGYSLCKANGIVNFIMPTKWTNSDYGLGIRKFVLEKQLSVKMINFSSFQVFNASTYSGIQWLTKDHSSKMEYLQLNHDVATAEELKIYLESIDNSDYAIMSLKDFTPKPWKLASNKETAQILSKISIYPKLKTILKYISQGTVTVGDDIFVMEGHLEGDSFYGHSVEAGKDVCIEASIMKPLLKGEDVKRYASLSPTHFIIYPHHKVSGKTVPYTEVEMQSLFPRTYAYMLPFKDKLIEKKKKYKTNPTYWYSLHRSRDINMFESTKILTPEISFGCNMTIDQEGLYHNTQNYTLMPLEKFKNKENKLLGILNSKLFWFFISNTGTILRGGYFRFKTKYIEGFPLPVSELDGDICNSIGELVSDVLYKKHTSSDADTSFQEQEIDRLVYKLYGLTFDEVKVVDSETNITEEEYNKEV